MTFNYRCTRKHCRKRVTRRKRLEHYLLEKYKHCPACGGRLSLDRTVKKRNKRQRCLCDGYAFPHREGTAPWCRHSTRPPTEEEWQWRQY